MQSQDSAKEGEVEAAVGHQYDSVGTVDEIIYAISIGLKSDSLETKHLWVLSIDDGNNQLMNEYGWSTVQLLKHWRLKESSCHVW